MYALLIAALIAAAPQGKPYAPKLQPQLIVVAEAQRAPANAAAVKVAGPKAAGTFSVPYTDEKGNVCYVCSWRMTIEQAAQFEAIMAAEVQGKKVAIYRRTKRATADESKFSGSVADKVARLKLTPMNSKTKKEVKE